MTERDRGVLIGVAVAVAAQLLADDLEGDEISRSDDGEREISRSRPTRKDKRAP